MTTKSAVWSMDKETIQITVVGDGTVGKTCMLIAFTTDDDLRNREYLPTIFDTYAGEIIVDDINYRIQLWDTAGQEGYERLRPLSYTSTSCFLVCFAVDSSSSYVNVLEKWVPEVRHFKPNVPIILVGTKVDQRTGGIDTIKQAAGENLKEKIQGYRYLECSALTREGIKEVFETAVRATLNKSQKQNTKRLCDIL